MTALWQGWGTFFSAQLKIIFEAELVGSECLFEHRQAHNAVEPEGAVVLPDPAEGYQQPVFLKGINGKGLYGSFCDDIALQAAIAYIYQLEMGECQL